MRRPRLLLLLLICAAAFAAPAAAAQGADPDGSTGTQQSRACGSDTDCDGTLPQQ